MSRGATIPHQPGTLVVVVDTREQTPLSFGPEIRTVTRGLCSGDYSVAGYDSCIAIERKSVADLHSSVTRDNARFQRELQTLSNYTFAAVVVEGSRADVRRGHRYSTIPGDQVLATCATLEAKHRVPFHYAGSRIEAAAMTLELLRAAWRLAADERRRIETAALEYRLRQETMS